MPVKIASTHIWLLALWALLQVHAVIGVQACVITASILTIFMMPEVVILYDWVASVFLGMVSTVGAAVFLYSYSYMKHTGVSAKFLAVLGLFCCSMVVLSLSGDLFWVIVGWDGLGFSSFCLVVFYQNWNAVSGGLVTFLCNRFGDLFIICCIGWLLAGESLTNAVAAPEIDVAVCLMLLVGSTTNSAQLPFSAWLPLAMAAPTPVSSLVHSSTLVTAGVFVVVRFSPLWDSSALQALFLLSSLTVLVAGVSSLYEWDAKNIVALSTLSHISLMLNVASLGSLDSCILHMVMHAFFNSLLFIGMGSIIHVSEDWQDLRRVGCLESGVDWVMIRTSLVCITGVPFMSGFYSNELIIVNVCSLEGSLVSVAFWLGAMFTASYSFRIVLYLSSCIRSIAFVTTFTSASWSAALVGTAFSVCGGALIWSSFDFALLVVNIAEAQLNLTLLLVVWVGLVLGLSSLSWSPLVFDILSTAWKWDSFAYFLTGVTCNWSWSVLYDLDVNGVNGSIISYLLSQTVSGFKLVQATLTSWPTFVVKLFSVLLMAAYVFSVF